jgi:uncharacterized protein (TIGR02099 family)
VKALMLSVAKKIAYVFAGLIIIAALLVCTSRLLTPLLDKHRPDFEKYASTLLDMPVSIGNVHVSWYRYQPAIGFDEVTVFNKEGKEPILQVRKIRLFFSIPASLWRWTLVPSGILISGTDVNLHESAEGQISVQGFPTLGGFNNQPYKNETKFIDIMDWLSQQPRLILQDVDASFTQKTGEKRVLTIYNLSFENAGVQHTVLGKATLHQSIPTDVTLALQWQGRVTEFEQIKAKIYLYLSGVTLPQWMKGLVWHGWQVNEGLLSAKVWATWNAGTLRKVQTTFQSYDLSLYSSTDKSTHKVNRLSGNVGWKREGKGQVVAGDDILIDLPSHLWPVTSFYFSLGSDANNQWYPNVATLGYVDLNDVQSFLFSSPSFLPDAVSQAMKALQIKGYLQNASITFANPLTDWMHTSLNANFSELGFAPWQHYPGARHLSGSMKWNGSAGSISLNTSRAVFQYPSLFTHPINIDQLSGDATFQQDVNKTWQWRLPSLQILNNDIAANLSGSLSVPSDKAPVVDMRANFTMQDVNRINRYLPTRVFDKDLVAWLDQAFLSGEVKSASAILRGTLTDFPFDKNNGVFSISGVVKNIDLRYAPDWPVMRHINGRLQFTGRKMTLNIDSAETLGIPIKNIQGLIPYFGDEKPQILQIQSDSIQTNFTQGMHFVHMSPLEKNIGKMFNGVNLQGPLILKLGLTVPLKKPDDTEVKGVITLKNAEMNLAPWSLVINNLNGHIQFTEKTTEAENIQGLLFGKPLTFNLATIQKTSKLSLVRVNLTSTLAMLDLQEWLKLPLSDYVHGVTDVQGEVDLSLQAPLELHLRTDMKGLTLNNLPAPYNKKAEETRNFTIDIFSQEKQPLRTQLSYDDLLAAALILDRKHGNLTLTGADIRIGGGASVAWPKTPGLYITGSFDKLDWNQIKGYLNQAEGSHFSTNKLGGLKLRQVDIQAKSVDLGGHSLNQVDLQVSPTSTNWNINVTSPDITGQLQVPMNFNRQASMTAQFQYINLHTTTSASGKNALPMIDVKSLPSISFVANNVTYNSMPLGQVSFKTLPSTSGLVIKSLTMHSARMNLQASGDWTQTNKSEVTHLRGGATSSRVSDLLNSFGFDVRNFIASKGVINFDLNWHDAPYAPSLANLNGRASLDLGAGRVVDIGQESGAKMGIGRMLSIFSLQTIPRRLSLDFSDVFQKGYSFDSIRGDFLFQNGDVLTNNLRFDGPVARVGINGRIGLKNKNYNFVLSVTPYVTSSLPVAAGLITMNPLVGLGALAVSSVIGSQVSKVTTYYYSVTGPWDNPVWKSGNTK